MVRGLERYEKILRNEALAKFLIAKEKGLLEKKIEKAEKILQSCTFCERRCKVNRFEKLGFCKVGTKWKVFGMHTHLGEEPELIPSATLFAAGCNMRCCYCQNAPHSITPALGAEKSEEEVARWIEKMYLAKHKNINFVGGEPTCYIYNILKTLSLVSNSANIPIIFNTNMYMSKEALEILDGIVDIYLADFRYFNEENAVKYSLAYNYPKAAKRNFLIAREQAELLIRLLVIPSLIESDALPILEWIAKHLGKDVRLNILAQYRPEFEAYKFEEINRRLYKEEYERVINYAKELGFTNFLTQRLV